MRLGRHMPTHSNAVKAAEIARWLGCNAIQIFASNPTGWRPTAGDPASGLAFSRAAGDKRRDPVVIYAAYLINLASPDEIIWEEAGFLLRSTLQRRALPGAGHVVVPSGKPIAF